jgi:orotidine-5'-phosphate decarboxylase
MMAFHKTVQYCKEKGLIVIGDIKRGDIGSTSAAYATGHIGKVTIGANTYEPFGEDFVTVNPYLGTDGIKPFVDLGKANGCGIYALVKTSNPSGAQLQDLDAADGRKIYEVMADFVSEWGADTIGECGYSSVGAVVGATWPQQSTLLRARMPHTPFLVPGYGAQGATGKDLAGCFDKMGGGAVVNASRSLLCAHQKKPEMGWLEAVRTEAIRMREDITAKY